MRIAFFSPKGGQGTSTVACAAALAATTTNVLLVDHTGDCSSILGLPSDGGTIGRVTVTLNPSTIFYVDPATTTVIHDCGASPLVAGEVDKAIVVIRSCYLAARRFVGSGERADGFVFVEEPTMGRALSTGDIARVVGADCIAKVTLKPVVARAIDAGIFGHRPLDSDVWGELIHAVRGVTL